MGYAWNRVCYQDTVSALDAFAKSVPDISGAGLNYLGGSPTISSTGYITAQIVNQSLVSSATTMQTLSVQLLSCSDDMAQYSNQMIVFLVACFFAAVFGFRVGYNR